VQKMHRKFLINAGDFNDIIANHNYVCLTCLVALKADVTNLWLATPTIGQGAQGPPIAIGGPCALDALNYLTLRISTDA